MKQCYQAWLTMSAAHAPVKELREMLARSRFQQQYVREVFAHCVANDFQEVSQELRAILRGVFQGIGQTK
eukprot:110319-Lingulodinium_polyedra.AAC.1